LANTAKTEEEAADYAFQATQADPQWEEAARRWKEVENKVKTVRPVDTPKPPPPPAPVNVPIVNLPGTTVIVESDPKKQIDHYKETVEKTKARQAAINKELAKLQEFMLAQFKDRQKTVRDQQAYYQSQAQNLRDQQKVFLADQRDRIKGLRDTESYYATRFVERPPFEIIYDPLPQEVEGSLKRREETWDLRFRVTTVGTLEMQVIPVLLADYQEGLETVGQRFVELNGEFDKVQSWLEQVEAAGRDASARLVEAYAAELAKVEAAERDYAAQLARQDALEKTTEYSDLAREYAVKPDARYAERLAQTYAVQPAGYNAVRDKTLGERWSLTRWNKDETHAFAIEAVLTNEATGKTIGTASVTLTNKIRAKAYTQPESASALCVFHDVSVNDSSNVPLKVTIRRVNGRDVSGATNTYIKISALKTGGYTADGWNIYGCDAYGFDRFGRLGPGRDGYDKDGYDRTGYDRGGYDRTGFNREGYNRKAVDRNGNYKSYRIGDRGPAGGWIFYDQGKVKDGWRYLEAAPEELHAPWGPLDLNIKGTKSGVGSGKENTVLLVQAQGGKGYAAQVCDDYYLNGFGDWFLPSHGELKLLYKNLAKKGGGFDYTWYWSSTQDNATEGKVVKFGSVDTGTGETFKKVIDAEWKFMGTLFSFVGILVIPALATVPVTLITAPEWMPVVWLSRYISASAKADNKDTENGVRPVRRF